MRQYFKIIPAVYTIFRKGDDILLLRRFGTGYLDGYYSLPAGHVDGGESAVMAAVREVEEEVGIKVDPKELKLVHTLHRTADSPVKHERIDLFFELHHWHGEPTNMESQKCDELRWVNINQLPANTVPEVAQALRMAAQGQSYSDFGFSLTN